MLVIGLTGGIGSGKSVVAQLFADLSVPIIDTDLIAREITQVKQAAFNKIVEHFGHDILLANGTINRAALRKIVFANAKERHWLENLLHPLIQEQVSIQIEKSTAPYCIVVIPLLLEVEFYTSINRVLVVDAPTDIQIKRVMARDHISQSEVEAILKTQASREARSARAQDIINNEGDLSELLPQVEKLHEKYLLLSHQTL